MATKVVLIFALIYNLLNIAFAKDANQAISNPNRVNGTEYSDRQVITLDSNLTYSEFNCTVNRNEIDIREIKLQPGSSLQMGIIPNPGAYQDFECPGGYAGTDLRSVIEKSTKTSIFKPIALTNGNFFLTRKKSKTQTGFAPIGMLWGSNSSKSGKLFSEFRMKGGKDLLIVDPSGAHKLSLHFETCKGSICISLASPSELDQKQNRLFTKNMTTRKFIDSLKTAFPKMTLASQMNMDLTGGHRDSSGKLIHFSQCETTSVNGNTDDDIRSHWKCKRLPRTLLCGRKDGSVSLLTALSAYVYDLAVGLRMNGVCATECSVLFNLDGGGSTQMAFLDPKKKQFRYLGNHHEEYGNERTLSPQDHCSSLRPVDHYFGFGTFQK